MLNKITIKNYKSSENVSLTLRPFNVFIGPNNAGKSNIFDCLMFLSELVSLGAPAISSRGGFQYLVWGGDTKRAISIEVEVSIIDPQNDQEKQFHYQIEIVGEPKGLGHLSKMRLTCRVKSAWRVLLESEAERLMARDLQGKELGWINLAPEFEWLRHYHPHWNFFRDLRDWRFYNPVPSRMADVQPVKKDLILQREGENLSRVLHTLHASYKHEFTEIEELVKTGVPEIEELFTELTDQGQTYATIREPGHSLTVPAWAMSDGTLRFLAHLAALYTPTPPPLMAFEEPENHIHPHLHALLADVLRGLRSSHRSL